MNQPIWWVSVKGTKPTGGLSNVRYHSKGTCVRLYFCVVSVSSSERVKRQDDEGSDEPNAEQLCEGRPADEYFRLTTEGDCRDVVRYKLALSFD